MPWVDNETVLTSARMGGAVLRYHTWPTIHKQTVMDHTGHVIRIYWQIFGEVPPEVCAYLIHHDLSEVRVGDAPHPIKLNNPSLKQIYDDLEDAALEEMIGEERAMQVLGSVTDTERRRMKACDLLEMAEFAAVEMSMGNTFAQAIVKNVARAISMLELSDADRALVEEHVAREVWRFAR